MSNLAIQVDNVYKAYRLGEVSAGSFVNDISDFFMGLVGKQKDYSKIGENDRTDAAQSEYVWALKDISFDVKQGEVLGIIGKNGAGKSTMLKLLSKVTMPTKGNIKIKGRIASLLEVGTGFHPDLTGRENIYLNGAILGMTKKEITRNFDEIVAFAGVEKYIDTPVKRYSSGMYVRLAFAVAAHLEPDVLIVDEVLAVGDAEFQRKCLGKMKDVSTNSGRTILFVSHNMSAVKTLCTRGVLLNNGQVGFIGNIDEAIAQYVGNSISNDVTNFLNLTGSDTFKNNDFQVLSVGVYERGMHFSDPIKRDSEIVMVMNLKSFTSDRLDVTFQVTDEEGAVLLQTTSGYNTDIPNGNLSGVSQMFTCIAPAYFFNEGTFMLNFLVVKNKRDAVLRETGLVRFNINPDKGEIGAYMGKNPGYFLPKFDWIIENV